MAWRRSLGIEDDVPAIAFLGRLVMEKGLDVFADAIDVLQRRGVPHKVVVIGEGPAREWFESRLPDANFVGFQGGADLRSEEHTSELQSLMRISYAVFCLNNKTQQL